MLHGLRTIGLVGGSRRVVALVAALAIAGPAGAQETWRIDEEDQWSLVDRPEPGTPEGQLEQIRRSIADGKPERAGDLATQWIERHPRHPLLPDAYLLRGDSWRARDNEYEALFDYEYVARVFSGSEAFVRALQREYEIAVMYTSGVKRKMWGMRIVDASDEAVELLLRINERVPGSSLAEQAALTLGDYYFRIRDMPLAVDTYTVFIENYPDSEQISTARRRLIYAHLASFKGPEFDAAGLYESRIKLEQLKVLEPANAQRIGAEALLEGIDESDAAKMLTTAKWYLATKDYIAAELTIRRLLGRYEQTAAARAALRIIPSILERLPETVRAQAPDYAAYRDALLGGGESAP